MDDRERRERRAADAIMRQIQKDIHAIYEKCRANTDGDQPPQRVTISSVPSPPEAITDYYAAENRSRPENTLRNRMRLGLDIGAFIAAVLAAIFTYRALSQTQKQTTLMHNQMVGTQGAALGLLTSLGEPGLDVSIDNYGMVTSKNTFLAITVSERELPSGRVIESKEHTFGPLAIPSRPSAARSAFQERIIPSKTWTIAGFKQFDELQATVRVEGALSWDNGFDESFRVPICQSYLAIPITNAAGQVVRPAQFVPCSDFDQAMSSAIKRKQEQESKTQH
jgi:hypothetical protein